MAPPRREIPGFYFDEVTNRYYRAEASHQAVPAARHTQQTVNARNAEQRAALTEAEWSQRLLDERVQRSMALYSPPQMLMREIGTGVFNSSRAQQQECQTRIVASQLRNSWRMETEPMFSSVYNIEQEREFDIKSVLRDPRTGTLVTALAGGQDSAIMVVYPKTVDQKWSYDIPEVELFEGPYDLSSMCFSNSTGHLCTTLNAGPQGSGYIAIHPFPDTTEHEFFQGFGVPLHIEINEPCSYWASAALPDSPIATFAVGGTTGLKVLEAGNSRWNLTRCSYEDIFASDLDSRASVNAVDWMSNEVVVAGMRSKAVVFHDIRSTNDGTFRLRHDKPVFQVKKVDDHRVLAMGPGSLKMYDLRWAADNGRASRPYLGFPEFVGRDIPTFDLSTELGLVVSPGQDERRGGHRVQSFSLQTGRRIDNPLAQKSYMDRSPLSVTFDRGNDLPGWRGPRGPSLLFGGDREVEEWTWGG